MSIKDVQKHPFKIPDGLTFMRRIKVELFPIHNSYLRKKKAAKREKLVISHSLALLRVTAGSVLAIKVKSQRNVRKESKRTRVGYTQM